ncbi:MAG: AAA family ATPase [Desulfuromonadales bacterium]|nr:AAA family ATPase [Desulfuromonadales bacterium]
MDNNGEIIVIGGKGGVGKTSLSAILVKLLLSRKLLVIDADPVVSVTYSLGEKPLKTIGDYRESLINDPRQKRAMMNKPMKSVIDEMVQTTTRGYDLLTMGRAEAKGCFCGINDLLRHGIQTLCNDYDLSLIDCEAGIEQVNRRTVHRIDKLVLVSDSSRRGIEALAQVRDLAVKYNDGAPLQVVVVINRVCSQSERNSVTNTAAEFGLEVAAFIPEDPNVRSFNSQGIPLVDLPDDSLSIAALTRVAKLLLPANAPLHEYADPPAESQAKTVTDVH